MSKEDKLRINLLVKEIGLGNDEAFEELYHLIYKELFYFLRKYNYDTEDIKDVIENTFLVIIEKSKNLLFYKNCYSWIFKIAKYQMFNFNRKLKPEVRIEDVNFKLADKKDTFLDVSLSFVVDKIPKDLKLIFYLKYKNNYTINEITKITKLSASTVKRRIIEIKTLFEEYLNEKEADWRWKN